ncbi:TetR/AcrR family transcriptional regulator [Flexivirga meconopsidis]|uniref:TetR/AcrR family transcriptional regulator n=1 Tax=Flexivirga meconopsidis TaxID=2977121 RepID=UPI00223FCE25|nr:TetR/AcrR family transcriptional regulator [Flexivirga meconopsidis]
MVSDELTPAGRRVLDAASALFYANGIHAIGVDTIAAEAGVTKKTLYDRFGSKEALVLRYLRERETQWQVQLGEALARHTEAGPERVLAVFDAAIERVGHAGGRGCSAINARAEVDDPDDDLAREVLAQKAGMRKLFRRLVSEAGYADPDELAKSLMLLYDGALATDGVGTFAAPMRAAQRTARRLLDGWS